MLLVIVLLILTANCPLTWAKKLVWEAESSCVNVLTSKGLRTLQHSQAACAPLLLDEPESNEGLRYLRCYLGKVYYSICPISKRFDVSTGACKVQSFASCELNHRNDFLETTSRSPRTVDKTDCNQFNCQLPNCSCFGGRPKAPPMDTPMFVMITFDDAVHNDLYNKFYKPLFVDNVHKLFNPNGCPIRIGMYVSMNNTNVTLVQEAYKAGHEIGSHTVNHSTSDGGNKTYAAVVDAIIGMKRRILELTGDKALHDSIVGFRTPYLKCVGDIKFDVLKDHGFLYDSSITNTENRNKRTPYWPYTLDYLPKRCVNCPCPKKQYPGLWEVPINAWLGEDGNVCSMVDGWTFDMQNEKLANVTTEQWYNYYNRHFLDYFYPYKVPMSYFSHGSIFYRSPNSYVALGQWLKDLLKRYPDVWIVPPKLVIEWMKRPLTFAEMTATKWGC